MTTPASTFPRDFAWGAVASSFQWEGAAFEDGKGASIWDMFTRKPGAIWNDGKLDVSSDGYHRYAEDVGLMKQIGLRAHDMSISWPRVLPEGTGTPNEKGLAFYDRFIDALLEAGVEPWVDLYHWDLPLETFYRGGFLNRDIADWFADYTALVVDRYSDRVSHWFTFTEPQLVIGGGYGDGSMAPGISLPFADVLRAGHNLLLAHGRAVQVIRARSRQAALVGYAPVGRVRMPLTDAPEDVEAARRSMFGVFARDMNSNTWWSDPMFFGRYPEDGWKLFGSDVPEIRPGDMETIAQPLDFHGANIYSGHYVRAADNGMGFERIPHAPDVPHSTMGWPIRPEVLYHGPKLFFEHYGLPIVISENGLGSREWVAWDGGVHDTQRIQFTRDHLLQLERAVADGVEVGGYFHWTWVDNFECAEGYKDRLGMVYCDFASGARILKDSGRWYGEVIRTNGAALHDSGA
jgi:beta-glucosidase